jgi:RNA polymerase sigma factor (sigma-70 family)
MDELIQKINEEVTRLRNSTTGEFDWTPLLSAITLLACRVAGLRQLSPEDAEDVAQEVTMLFREGEQLLSDLRSIATINPGAFVRCVANRRSIDAVRKVARRTTQQDLTDRVAALPAQEKSPLEESIASEESAEIAVFLRSLPEKTREVVCMRLLNPPQPFAKIAEALGISETMAQRMFGDLPRLWKQWRRQNRSGEQGHNHDITEQ